MVARRLGLRSPSGSDALPPDALSLACLLRRTVLLAGLFVLATALPALGDDLPHRHLTEHDGLPGGNITALAQTPNGLLWIGTQSGLAVYDGTRFRSIAFPDSIGTAYVYSLRAMDDGSVWVSPSLGEAYKVRYDGVVRGVPAGRQDGNNLFVRRILARRDTVVFVTRTGVSLLPRGGEALTHRPFRYDIVSPSAVAPDSPAGVGAFDADVGPDGEVWILDGRLGPGRLRDNGTVAFAGGRRGRPQHFWWEMHFAAGGDAFATRDEQLFRFDPATERFEGVADSLGDPTYLSVQGSRVYTTRGTAVMRRNAASGRSLPPFGPDMGLPERVPTRVLRGANGDLWIGTRDGLTHLPAPQGRHVHTIDGAAPFNVSQFMRQGRALWARSHGGGFFQLRPRQRHVRPDGITGWEHDVISRDGALHALSSSPGRWYSWRPETGWSKVRPAEEAIRGFVDSSGAGYFWHSGGLSRYPPTDERPSTSLVGWPEEHSTAHHVAPGRHDRILHLSGTTLLSRRPDSGTVRDTLARLPDGLRDAVHEMRAGPNEQAWVASKQGLLRVDLDTGTVRFPIDDGAVWDVRLSGDSLAIASTRDRGVYFVDAGTGAVRQRLTRSDGLRSNNALGAYLGADTLFVGHASGISRLPAAGLFPDPSPPKVLLTGWEVDFEDRPIDADTTLQPGVQSIGFAYAGVELAHPNRMRYQVRLVPRDTTWRTTGRAFTRFTDLPPGSYRFEVRARLDGRTPGPVAARSFVVPPHFYQTWWFRVALALGLLALGLGAYRWQVRSMRRRQEELQRAVARRTEALAREKRKTEEQAERLAELDAAKNRFFSQISHEFRTPLSLILGPLRDALRQAPDGRLTFGTEQVQRMLHNAERLQRLIEQMLDLATLEAEEMSLDRKPTDLEALIWRTADAFVALAERKSITLNVDVPDDAASARIDPDKVEKIVSNLLSNALKYTPEGGRVDVRLAYAPAAGPDAPGGEGDRIARLSVADTGPGIRADRREAVFKPFRQVDASTTRDHEGTGLGLALTRDLVDLHDGSIELDSTPGEGSTFTVHLPAPVASDAAPGGAPSLLAGDGADVGAGGGHAGDGQAGSIHPEGASPEDAPSVDPASGDGSSGDGPLPDARPARSAASTGDGEAADPDGDCATVLVVEDNDEMRAFLEEKLSALWNVVSAPNGHDAWALVQESPPDLVLSDIMMPGLDGIDLCRRIKADEELRAVPVVLLTARATTDDAVEGLDAGADDYIEKPFDVEELRQRLRSHLAAREHLRSRYRREVRLTSMEAVVDEEHVPFIERLDDAVAEHLDNPDFTVDRLAAEMALSRRQLTRRMKEAVDETPASYIRQRRLDHAEALLGRNPQTIAEVAYAVGFRSPSAFSKAFREHAGCTPTEYVDANASS